MPLRTDVSPLLMDGYPPWRSVVEGYTGRESYEPGERVTVHCSSAVPEFDVTVTRVGARRDVVWSAAAVPGQFRDVSSDVYSSGCGWPVSLEIPTDRDWPSGFYEVRFSWPGSASTGDVGTYACFVLRSTRPSPDVPLLVLSTTTWQAYNEWGGSGLYRGAPIVSLDRPYDRGLLYKRSDIPAVRVTDVGPEPDPRQQRLREYLQDNGYGSRAANAGWFEWERRFVGWAESNGYPLDFAVGSDLAFHPEVLDGRRLVISVGHDEYWSTGMRDAVEDFMARGGNAAFFSGDLCSSKIRFAEDGRSWSSYVMQLDLSADPAWPDGDVTGVWSDPFMNRPETRMTGVSTLFAGYARFGVSTPRGPRGFLVQQPGHWVLAGTGVEWGDAIGVDDCLAGFEMCGCDVELRANRLAPSGRFGTPADAQIIAVAPAHLWRHGEASDLFDDEGQWDDSVLLVANLLHDGNPTAEDIDRLSNGWATMLVMEPGGTVFTAATTEWAFCLEDPVIDRMTRNVLDRLLDRPPT